MVYAGYTPAKLPVVPTDLDRAVMAVTNMETLEIISKLLYNAAVNPKEDKYRKIRLSNDKIRAVIAEVPGAVEMLLGFGWELETQENALIIPAGKYMSMKEVRMVEDQKDRAKKLARKQQTEVLKAAAGSSAASQASA